MGLRHWRRRFRGRPEAKAERAGSSRPALANKFRQVFLSPAQEPGQDPYSIGQRKLLDLLFYLTAFADRFLVVSKESIMTPQGGLGGIRGESGGAHYKQTVTHFVVFEFPELHSRATF